MRTVSRMVQEIHDELVFNPDLRQYTDSLVRRLQNKYTSLAEKQAYTFFQRVDTIELYAEVEGLAATRTLTTAATNLRMLTANAASWLDAGWAGCGTFIAPDGEEIAIRRVDTVNQRIYLETPVSGAFTGSADWSIEFRSYLLPKDTIDILGYRDDKETDGWGRLVSISRMTAEKERLKPTHEGHPVWAIEQDAAHRRPPFEAPTLTADVNGSLPQRKFEYRYTILGSGLESPPSPTAEITLTGAQDEVTVSDLEEIRWDPGTGLVESGLQIRLYRRDVTKRGRWLVIATMDGATAAADFNDTVLLPATAATWDEVIYLNPEGYRQTARFYYTADENRTISLRIWFRPSPFQSNSDMPLGPGSMPDYLVNSVLADMSSGEHRKRYYARSMEAQENLSNFLAKSDIRHRRSSWKHDQLESRFVHPVDRNLGIPSIS